MAGQRRAPVTAGLVGAQKNVVFRKFIYFNQPGKT